MTSCWLIELAKKSPSEWQFHGVDISKLQFPADEYLPKNISLETMNVFGDIPDDFIEKFDVVHIRTFAVAVTHSNPIPLIKNLVRMLSEFTPFLLPEYIIVENTLMVRAPCRARGLSAMGRIRPCDFQCPRPKREYGKRKL